MARKRKPSGRGKKAKITLKVRSIEIQRRVQSLAIGLFGRKFYLKKAKPLNPKLIIRRLHEAVSRKTPVNLVVFWGGAKKSPATLPDFAEETTLMNLSNIKENFEKIGVKTNITLLTMDIYEDVLNERPQKEIGTYITQIKKMAEQFDFNVQTFSEIYSRNGFNPKKLRPTERKMQERVRILYENIQKDAKVIERLRRLAREHGKGNVEETVRKYVILHAFDDLILNRSLPDAIYISFGNPTTQKEISSLPTVFLYQNKEAGKAGELGVPWFTIKN